MKRFLILLLLSVLFMSSCSIEATIPENSRTFSHYLDNKELYQDAVSYFETLDFPALVSRNDYYSIKGSEDYTDLYIQNMDDLSISACKNPSIQILFEQTDVKLIDWIRMGNLEVCAFDMCIPGKNFDYGILYTSEDSPIYFGDPSVELAPSGNGFCYEKKASYGAKFTYYTEKIADHFYYYEIA